MLAENKSELLFSYGTLRDESTQLSLFGRRLEGSADSLIGYSLKTVEITDQEFAARNGAMQRNAQFTGINSDLIEGEVLKITTKELELADEYEPTDYKRVLVKTKSGASVWLYVLKRTTVST
jgi:gamma-glutamylcyclotransferase (GGCT)/AIG2-like uncharacterized protein YtfP